MRLIDADALKARFYMKDDCSDCHACDYDETYIDPGIICSTIDDMPTIEPERKKGKWDKKSIAFSWKCSECGAVVNSDRNAVFLYPTFEQIYFCPYCGADMRGEQ